MKTDNYKIRSHPALGFSGGAVSMLWSFFHLRKDSLASISHLSWSRSDSVSSSMYWPKATYLPNPLVHPYQAPYSAPS